jgi:hypothetical protein
MKHWFDRTRKRNEFSGKVYGPGFMYLSESMQSSIVEYLFSLGIRPELGMCIEYLSWNKEQRLYLAWLRDFYFYLYNHEAP